MIIITKDFAHPYFSEKMSDKDVHKKKVEVKNDKFEIGKLYSLQGETCEDFKMPIKIYELIAIIKSLNGIQLNSIVVKEISETDDSIFSLTKLDCSLLGVSFQRGLELYPMSLDWKKVEAEKNESKDTTKDLFDMKYFSSIDLSTYPVNRGDKTIKNMIVEIKWLDFCNNNSELNTINNYPSNIKFNYTEDIKKVFRQSMIIPHCYGIMSKIVTKDVSDNPSPYNNLIDLNGNVYIELTFLFKSNRDKIGLVPELIKDKSLFDIVQIVVENDSKVNVSVESKKKKNEELLSNRHSSCSSLEVILNDYYKNRNRGRRDLLDVYNEIKRVNKLSESLDKHFKTIYETGRIIPNYINNGGFVMGEDEIDDIEVLF